MCLGEEYALAYAHLGAFLDHHPKEGEAPPMKGSALIVNADTVEEIRETLANDIYTTSGVWDLDNVCVATFSRILIL